MAWKALRVNNTIDSCNGLQLAARALTTLNSKLKNIHPALMKIGWRQYLNQDTKIDLSAFFVYYEDANDPFPEDFHFFPLPKPQECVIKSYDTLAGIPPDIENYEVVNQMCSHLIIEFVAWYNDTHYSPKITQDIFAMIQVTGNREKMSVPSSNKPIWKHEYFDRLHDLGRESKVQIRFDEISSKVSPFCIKCNVNWDTDFFYAEGVPSTVITKESPRGGGKKYVGIPYYDYKGEWSWMVYISEKADKMLAALNGNVLKEEQKFLSKIIMYYNWGSQTEKINITSYAMFYPTLIPDVVPKEINDITLKSNVVMNLHDDTLYGFYINNRENEIYRIRWDLKTNDISNVKYPISGVSYKGVIFSIDTDVSEEGTLLMVINLFDGSDNSYGPSCTVVAQASVEDTAAEMKNSMLYHSASNYISCCTIKQYLFFAMQSQSLDGLDLFSYSYGSISTDPVQLKRNIKVLESYPPVIMAVTTSEQGSNMNVVTKEKVMIVWLTNENNPQFCCTFYDVESKTFSEIQIFSESAGIIKYISQPTLHMSPDGKSVYVFAAIPGGDFKHFAYAVYEFDNSPSIGSWKLSESTLSRTSNNGGPPSFAKGGNGHLFYLEESEDINGNYHLNYMPVDSRIKGL